MQTFTLMSNGERSVITSTPEYLDAHLNESSRGSVDAETWLDAKAALGFGLTPLQAQMLPLDHGGRATLASRSL